MRAITDLINYRLSSKGLSQVEISRFIKDVVNVVEQDQKGPFMMIQRSLTGLGWSEHILGEHDLDLICLYRETIGNGPIGPAQA